LLLLLLPLGSAAAEWCRVSFACLLLQRERVQFRVFPGSHLTRVTLAWLLLLPLLLLLSLLGLPVSRNIAATAAAAAVAAAAAAAAAVAGSCRRFCRSSRCSGAPIRWRALRPTLLLPQLLLLLRLL
jgi:hypothetical protein